MACTTNTYVIEVETHDDEIDLTPDEVGEAVHTWRYGHDVVRVEKMTV